MLFAILLMIVALGGCVLIGDADQTCTTYLVVACITAVFYHLTKAHVSYLSSYIGGRLYAYVTPGVAESVEVAICEPLPITPIGLDSQPRRTLTWDDQGDLSRPLDRSKLDKIGPLPSRSSSNTSSILMIAPSYGALRRPRSSAYPPPTWYDEPVQRQTLAWARPRRGEVPIYTSQAVSAPVPAPTPQITEVTIPASQTANNIHPPAPTTHIHSTQVNTPTSWTPQRKHLFRARKSASAPISRSYASSTSSCSSNHRVIISRSVRHHDIARLTRCKYYALGVRINKLNATLTLNEHLMEVEPSTQAPSSAPVAHSHLIPSLGTLSIQDQVLASGTTNLPTNRMAGMIIAGNDVALDAASTPEATMSSPSLTDSSVDMSAPGTPSSPAFGSPMLTLGSPFQPSTSTFPGLPMEASWTPTFGSPMATLPIGASPMPQESPLSILEPTGSPMWTTTTPPESPPLPPPATPEGSPTMTTTPQGTPFGAFIPQVPSLEGPSSPLVESFTPGLSSSNVLQGPSATVASSPSQGSGVSDEDEDEDEDEGYWTEVDGVAYVLTEEMRRRMIRLIKVYLGQQKRLSKFKLRTHSGLEREVKRMERRLMGNRPGYVLPTPRREEVLAPRANYRREDAYATILGKDHLTSIQPSGSRFFHNFSSALDNSVRFPCHLVSGEAICLRVAGRSKRKQSLS